jgi:hypothetical protein
MQYTTFAFAACLVGVAIVKLSNTNCCDWSEQAEPQFANVGGVVMKVTQQQDVEKH